MNKRTDRRPFEPENPVAPVARGNAPWPEVPQPQPAVRELCSLKLRQARNLIARVLQLELAEAGEIPAGSFRVVVEVDLQTKETLPCTWDHDKVSPTEALASLGGGLSLLLNRDLSAGDDFVVLTREQREWLEKIA